MGLIQELRRRDVIKVGFAYIVTGWILTQLASVASPLVGLPYWFPKVVLLMLLVGFVPVLILTWAFVLTPQGFKLEKDVADSTTLVPKPGHKLDILIIIALGLSLGFYVWRGQFEHRNMEVDAVAEQAAGAAGSSIDDRSGDRVVAPRLEGHSIAVLPFANRSGEPQDVYFTDGIHEDLLIQLSRVDAFTIISRSSVMEYRDSSKDIGRIAAELGVAHVMEGSVQRAGDRVRINVQLINADDERHLWAEIYDRELTTDNLFDIQSEIAVAIANELKTTLSDSEIAEVGEAPTSDVGAYDLYLKARQATQSETQKGYELAIELYQQAVALDDSFQLAWIGLARAYMTNYWVYGGDLSQRELAREVIDRAREIQPGVAELFMAEGFYWYWGFLDYERALYNLNRAIEMMPGNDEAWMWRGWVSRRAGQWDQASESMQRALQLNPRVHFNWHEYALTLNYLHRYEEAREAAATSMTLAPESFWGKTTMARILLQANGDDKQALVLVEGAQQTADYDFLASYLMVHIHAREFEGALQAARNLDSAHEVRRNIIALKEEWAARILHFSGRHDEAEQAAKAARFRLKNMRVEFGDDYRIDLAEAMLSAILGADPDTVRSQVRTSKESKPVDAVETFRFQLEHARIFAIAGMTEDAVALLEPLLQPPSDTSLHEVTLDPAFDRIRNDEPFVAMVERNQ